MSGVLCEVEELDLGCTEHLEAGSVGSVQVASQYLPRVALEWRPIQVGDVAEHGARRLVRCRPGEKLERACIGACQHVALLYPTETVDGRSVELQALLEHRCQLGRGDCHRLVSSQHVGEPEAYQTDTALLHRS